MENKIKLEELEDMTGIELEQAGYDSLEIAIAFEDLMINDKANEEQKLYLRINKLKEALLNFLSVYYSDIIRRKDPKQIKYLKKSIESMKKKFQKEFEDAEKYAEESSNE